MGVWSIRSSSPLGVAMVFQCDSTWTEPTVHIGRGELDESSTAYSAGCQPILEPNSNLRSKRACLSVLGMNNCRCQSRFPRHDRLTAHMVLVSNRVGFTDTLCL